MSYKLLKELPIIENGRAIVKKLNGKIYPVKRFSLEQQLIISAVRQSKGKLEFKSYRQLKKQLGLKISCTYLQKLVANLIQIQIIELNEFNYFVLPQTTLELFNPAKNKIGYEYLEYQHKYNLTVLQNLIMSVYEKNKKIKYSLVRRIANVPIQSYNSAIKTLRAKQLLPGTITGSEIDAVLDENLDKPLTTGEEVPAVLNEIGLGFNTIKPIVDPDLTGNENETVLAYYLPLNDYDDLYASLYGTGAMKRLQKLLGNCSDQEKEKAMPKIAESLDILHRKIGNLAAEVHLICGRIEEYMQQNNVRFPAALVIEYLKNNPDMNRKDLPNYVL